MTKMLSASGELRPLTRGSALDPALAMCPPTTDPFRRLWMSTYCGSWSHTISVSAWRRVQDLGLSGLHKTNDDFRLYIQSHMAVALRYCLCLVCQTWSDTIRYEMYFNVRWASELVQYLLDASKMFFGLSPKETRKLAFQFATDLGKPVPEIWKITLSAGEDCFSGFTRRHCGQQDCYSLKCSYVRKFFFRMQVLRFCVCAIHHRFANISYVRAARDDRIVGVVDECKGQSL